MKKKNCLWQSVVSFVHRELEATLAVLIVFAFIFGYSFAADNTIDAGDTADVIQFTDDFVINGVTYQGLNFTASNQATKYRVRTGFTPGTVATTTAGTKGIATGAQYTYKLTLGQPINTTAYLHGSYTSATVNGKTVTGPTVGVSISGSTITINFTGGDVLAGLYKTAGSTGTAPTPEIKTLYLIPSVTSVEVNMERTFNVVALDIDGNSASATVTWTITQGSEFATIDPRTGVLIGVEAGGPVTIRATHDGVSASATVTVKEASATTLRQIIEKQTRNQETTRAEVGEETDTTTYPGAPDNNVDSDNLLGLITVPTTGGETTSKATEAALDLFADEQVAQRIEETGSTHPTQAEINTIAKAQTTLVQRVAVRATAAIREVATSLQEMFVGRTIPTENGQIYKVPNVFQRIGSFLVNLFTGNPGAGASTDELLRAETGEGDVQ